VDIVRNGWIGEITEIHVDLRGDFSPVSLLPEEPVPADIDYDRWLGPAPWRPYNKLRVLGTYGGGWRIFWDYGSRINGDWGAHHFDIVQWALDMDGNGPVLFVPKGFEGSPYQYHQYANGLKVTASLKGGGPANGAMIRFVGKNGEVKVSRGEIETTPAGLEAKSKPRLLGWLHKFPRPANFAPTARMTTVKTGSTQSFQDGPRFVRPPSAQAPLTSAPRGNRRAPQPPGSLEP